MGHMLPQLRMCKDFRMTLSLNLWKCLPVSIKFVNFASLIWFHFNHQPDRSWNFNRKLPHLRRAALSWLLSTAQPSFNNDLQRNHLVPLITSRLFWIYISPYKNFALKTAFYDFKGFLLKDCNIYWFDEFDSYFLPRLCVRILYSHLQFNLLVYKLKYWPHLLPLWEEDSPKCRRIIE